MLPAARAQHAQKAAYVMQSPEQTRTESCVVAKQSFSGSVRGAKIGGVGCGPQSCEWPPATRAISSVVRAARVSRLRGESSGQHAQVVPLV